MRGAAPQSGIPALTTSVVTVLSGEVRSRMKLKTIKYALTTASVLGYFVKAACVEVRTYASGHGIGAVMAQTVEYVTCVIAYPSRTPLKVGKELFHQ